MSCIFTTKTYGAYKFQHPHIFYTRAHVTRQPAFTATRSRFAKLTALRLLINGDSYQRHFSANTMCQLFLDIYKAVGLKDASSHSGRRTYITRLANKGVGVRLLAELAGHSHISTTQRYIDVNSEQLSEAVELL
jgi:site-specific recombinase XerD